jgi:hypothetical protein
VKAGHSFPPCMHRPVVWNVAWLLRLACSLVVSTTKTTTAPMLLAVVLAAAHQHRGRKCASFAYHRQRITSQRSLTFLHSNPKRICSHQDESVVKNKQRFPVTATRNADASNDRLSGGNNSSNNNNDSLEAVQHAIFGMTHGPINLNSPKQVSQAIFGTAAQSTSREILQMAAQGKMAQLDPTSQKLASLVLEYRRLVAVQAAKKPAVAAATPFRKSRSFSALANDSTRNGVEDQEAAFVGINSESKAATDTSTTATTATFVSPYDLQVESLFTLPKGKIHDYWKEPLLQLTRPSARSLVSQLNAKICPNGYDPLAVTTTSSSVMDPLRSSSGTSSVTSMAGKKGSFLAYCREQKEKYPDCVILVSAPP